MRKFSITIVIALAVLAIQSWAAEITYRITNDAGVVVASGKVETNDAVLAQVEVWRIEQQEQAQAQASPVDAERLASMAAIIKGILVTFITTVLNDKPTPELKRQLEQYNAARQAIKSLVEAAAH